MAEVTEAVEQKERVTFRPVTLVVREDRTTVQVCESCGALVADPSRHREWHARWDLEHAA